MQSSLSPFPLEEVAWGLREGCGVSDVKVAAQRHPESWVLVLEAAYAALQFECCLPTGQFSCYTHGALRLDCHGGGQCIIPYSKGVWLIFPTYCPVWRSVPPRFMSIQNLRLRLIWT